MKEEPKSAFAFYLEMAGEVWGTIGLTLVFAFMVACIPFYPLVWMADKLRLAARLRALRARWDKTTGHAQ